MSHWPPIRDYCFLTGIRAQSTTTTCGDKPSRSCTSELGCLLSALFAQTGGGCSPGCKEIVDLKTLSRQDARPSQTLPQTDAKNAGSGCCLHCSGGRPKGRDNEAQALQDLNVFAPSLQTRFRMPHRHRPSWTFLHRSWQESMPCYNTTCWPAGRIPTQGRRAYCRNTARHTRTCTFSTGTWNWYPVACKAARHGSPTDPVPSSLQGAAPLALSPIVPVSPLQPLATQHPSSLGS